MHQPEFSGPGDGREVNMWTLIKREVKDETVILLIGLAVVIVTGTIALITDINKYNDRTTNPLGLSQSFEALFNIGTILFSLLVTALGINQVYKDRTKKISAFLVTLATTRQWLLVAKILLGIIFIIIGFVMSALPVMIMLKKYPPILPVDYSVLLIKWLFGICFGFTSYMLGLVCGFSKSQWGFVVLPIILLLLIVWLLIMPFSPVLKFAVLFVTGLAFLIYARQQFLRVSL
jgi:hypothetical protein